jgi:hypothetical protein
VATSISDEEYDTIRSAADWINRHAGTDAPAYPEIRTLRHVIESIGQRRERRRDQDDAGDLRDEKATERDLKAKNRDRTSDRRDTRAVLYGEDDDDVLAAYKGHRLGASDRTNAADDREAAHADRVAAAEDRKEVAVANKADDDPIDVGAD